MNSESRLFQFGTKSANLLQLEGTLKHARVCEVQVILVREWQSDPVTCIDTLKSKFGDQLLIFRSSGSGEDSAEASFAGAFDSVANVSASDQQQVVEAFKCVIESYAARKIENIECQEVLIQPMVVSPVASGVMFTRDLSAAAPYYVLNYEISDRTDGVTGGASTSNQFLCRILRDVHVDELESKHSGLVLLARELEAVTSSDCLDIEFAFAEDGQLYLLQVRPLVQTTVIVSSSVDRRLMAEAADARDFLKHRLSAALMFGQRTILGEMPDWNPAEVIGSRAKPLASSLYRRLILDDVWRLARAELGYYNPEPYGLLVRVLGRPYVDVRASFNSFLPDDLPESLATRLVDYYLNLLEKEPTRHDKVEFEIVVTCLTFDFTPDRKRLVDAGFSSTEIEVLVRGLRRITNKAVLDTLARQRRFASDTQKLSDLRDRALNLANNPVVLPHVVDTLLSGCSQYGTLPFSLAARCAFIGNSLVRSLVSQGALSEKDCAEYMAGIETVAGQFVADLDQLRRDLTGLSVFLSKYGHLRPGTYDICTPTYKDKPEEYLLSTASTSESSVHVKQAPVRLSAIVDEDMYQRLATEAKFEFTVEELDEFVSSSVKDRELLKFEFSKNISAALDCLSAFGQFHGFSNEKMSFLEIEEVTRYANDSLGTGQLKMLRQLVDARQERHDMLASLSLPDLIFSEKDVSVVRCQALRPNFVTSKRIVGEALVLVGDRGIPSDGELEGKIVLIENADPGYDWLFAKGIGGLCTRYGGAASHMTIRCSEFGLPAAIGCGEKIFSDLMLARTVSLDCAQEKVEPFA
ncbi:MAG: PEP/pyruvate-binding domain-containing protein [Pseudomonadales bacterium]